jgi:hypothetical protein
MLARIRPLPPPQNGDCTVRENTGTASTYNTTNSKCENHTHTYAYPLIQEFATMTAKREVNKAHKIYKSMQDVRYYCNTNRSNISYTA